MATFSDRVKAARNRRRGADGKPWSQADLAEAIGSARNTIDGWENRGVVPRPAVIEQLARVLGVRADWLRGQSDDPGTPLDNPEPPAPTYPQRARAFINRFMAELAEAGVSAHEEEWARRTLNNPDNIGFNVGGNSPTLDEEAMLRDIEGMSIGVRMLLIHRGYKNLKPR